MRKTKRSGQRDTTSFYSNYEVYPYYVYSYYIDIIVLQLPLIIVSADGMCRIKSYTPQLSSRYGKKKLEITYYKFQFSKDNITATN